MNFFKRSKDVTKAPAAPRFETLIGPKTSIKGNLEFDKAVRIDGSIEGDITPADYASNTAGGPLTFIMIGKEGVVSGSVDADTVHVDGSLIGNISGTWVRLSATAHVRGDVSYHQTIQIEPGAKIEGQLIRTSSLHEVSPLKEDPEDLDLTTSSPAPGQVRLDHEQQR
jgi:cytoskeletal protein CcmA (bactofilin family)